MSDCIYIKENNVTKTHSGLKLDHPYHFAVYGNTIHILNKTGTVCIITIHDFKECFSYLQDSQGRIML